MTPAARLPDFSEPARAVEPELILDERGSESRLRAVGALGLLGTALALLTMAAAAGFGLLALFRAPLLAAALSALLWPLIFGPEFTLWVFGAPAPAFWKLFLLFLAAQAAARLLRRQSWQRK